MADSKTKTILLTAASGNIGKVLVPLLVSRDSNLRLVLPTSSAEQLQKSNPAAANSNVAIEQGSIRDPTWLESILTKHNVDAVFLCVTGTDEMFTALNCLDATAKADCVKKLVYLSILGDFTSEAGVKDTYTNRSYPHLFAKVVVEHKLIYGQYPFEWTVLGPPFFFSNDLRQKATLTQLGVYHEPDVKSGGSKISIEDISLAASNVLLDGSGKWNSRKIMLGSKHSYTTSEVGELWSKALGKPIKTQPATKDILDQFEQGLRGAMGPEVDGLAWARDLRLMFEYSTVHGIHISGADHAVQLQLLGKEPDDYGEFVRKTAASWK